MVLKKCFYRVSQNLAVESIFVRSLDTLAKAFKSFERNTHLFSETFVQFSDNKACKMAEVGNKP